MHLRQCRREIDNIDSELLRLLNTRVRLVVDIAERKRQRGTGIRDPQREREVLERLTKINKGPTDYRAINAIFRRIIGESRRIAIASAQDKPKR